MVMEEKSLEQAANYFLVVFAVFLLFSLPEVVTGSSSGDDPEVGATTEMWWSLGLRNSIDHQNPNSNEHHHHQQQQQQQQQQNSLQNDEDKILCNQATSLSAGQIKFCHIYEDHMKFISRGAGSAISECQHQFKNRRWNCSIVDERNVFGPVVEKATRESAFVHAVMAAGVVHSVSRACRDGDLTRCGCSKKSRPKKAIHPDWLWGGCGDNTDYGYQFASGFVDVREKEKNYPRHSKGLSRMLMNLHNNEVGRRAVYKYVKIGCKCHGVSGSCNVRTCWNQLPSFRQTGDRLRDRYDAAIRAGFNRQGTRLVKSEKKFKRATKDDLIYTERSPDFCEADSDLGSLGTRGRQCDRHSGGTDGCGLMCCGRGYRSQRARISERCNCRFQWCCQVSCQTCERTVDIHICK